MGIPRTDDRARQLMHEFTVQSLVFAFDALEWLGPCRPVAGDGGFRIGDENGGQLTDASGLARALCVIGAMAPAATGALEKFGTPTQAGTDAGGALAEAYDRWTQRRED